MVRLYELSHAGKRLVRLMQDIYFGYIEGLHVRNGEPVFIPLPRIVREIKLGGENGPRHEPKTGDFVLKAQVAALFEHFARLGNGTVDRIEIKHGIPFRMNVEEKLRA